MARKSLLLLFFLVAAACDTRHTCLSGHLGCWCAEGQCLTGLECRSNRCVDPNGDAGTADAAAGDGGGCGACDSPPAPHCTGAATLRTYAAAGTCAAGVCAYAPTDISCPSGCDAGACTGACSGVTCNSPPNECYEPAGTCSDGACTYPYRNIECNDGDSCTSGDVCSLGVCRGSPQSCNSPPPPSCSGGRLRSYSTPGSCSAGGCSYTMTETECPAGCDGSTCAMPGLLASGSFGGDGTMAQDATSLYVCGNLSGYPLGALVRVDKSSGSVTPLADAGGNCRGIAVSGSYVYWSNLNDVYRVPASGGARTRLAPADGSPLAVSGSYAYLLTSFAGEIQRIPITGGTPATFVSGQPVCCSAGAMTDVLALGSYLYWVVDGNSSANGYVRRASTTGTAVASNIYTALGAGTPSSRISAIGTDGNEVFWISSAGLSAYNPSTGATRVLDASLPASSYYSWGNLAVGSTSIYYADLDGAVHRSPKAGGPGSAPWSLAASTLVVDASALYIATPSGIYRVRL
ncbi:MAG: hypothetical protein IT378_22825 [Sandaracinaceae bacterium]|nr:hypothetical protein [Sandaracinaceae bacterium]